MGWFDKKEELVARERDRIYDSQQRRIQAYGDRINQSTNQLTNNLSNTITQGFGGLAQLVEHENKQKAAAAILNDTATDEQKGLNAILAFNKQQDDRAQQEKQAAAQQELRNIAAYNSGTMSEKIDMADIAKYSPRELQNFYQGQKDRFRHSGQGETHQTTDLLTRKTVFESNKKETEEEKKARQFSYSDELSYQENEKVAEWLDAMGIEDVSRLIRREGSRNFFTKEGKESYLKYFGQKHVKNILDKQLPTLPTSQNMLIKSNGSQPMELNDFSQMNQTPNIFNNGLPPIGLNDFSQMNQTPNIFNNGLPPIGLNDFSQDGEESYGNKQAISKFNPKIFNYRRQQ